MDYINSTKRVLNAIAPALSNGNPDLMYFSISKFDIFLNVTLETS